MDKELLVDLTVQIVITCINQNAVVPSNIPTLIRSTYDALAAFDGPPPAVVPEKPQGAVSARKSLANPAHIISMIDGKAYKMLRRHLDHHGYTPASYRETFGLPVDYPMTAPAYSEQRRDLAKSIGLGTKRISKR